MDDKPAASSAESARGVALARLVSRLLAAAASGTGLVLGWWGFFLGFPDLPFSLVSPRQVGSDCEAARVLCEAASAVGGALISFLLTTALVLGLSLPIGWGLLWLLRVRPAYPTALLGPVLAWAIGSMADRLTSIAGGEPPVALAGCAGIGYATAAFVTTTTLPRYWRFAVLSALVVAWLLLMSLVKA
ncbi:hypothetical protein FHU38_002916 [Saccharomonospora amisosensis]|uniref:Uncharacterized protein n=1 Tax=Saccharomonospora amisosensis TaxID=1128677 RepID=A0A7X5UQX7_9PSEU|nr:hypothetical protein [Saccharomonospora amisosensis]NIJ12572.1 hypothetical protein [Saccharomonospora amisosensis]